LKPFWTFTDLVPADRQRAMLGLVDFAEVLALVAAQPVVAFSLEPRKLGDCFGTSRAFFKIDAGVAVYDAFFNSPVGLRSQYCRSIEQGEHANRRLVDSVTRNCLAHPSVVSLPPAERRLVEVSLASSAAKAWINDADWNAQCDTQILHGPWLAKAAASNTGPLAQQMARVDAQTGLLAPCGTYIEVKGGWLWPSGEQCFDPDKIGRSAEIRDYGCA